MTESLIQSLLLESASFRAYAAEILISQFVIPVSISDIKAKALDLLNSEGKIYAIKYLRTESQKSKAVLSSLLNGKENSGDNPDLLGLKSAKELIEDWT